MERLFKERCPDKPSKFKIERSTKLRDFNFGMFCTKLKSFTSFKFRKESRSSWGMPESTATFSTELSPVPKRSRLLRLLKEERGERSMGLLSALSSRASVLSFGKFRRNRSPFV